MAVLEFVEPTAVRDVYLTYLLLHSRTVGVSSSASKSVDKTVRLIQNKQFMRFCCLKITGRKLGTLNNAATRYAFDARLLD